MSEGRSAVIEILTVGDEILSGTIVDTNSALIARKLFEVGLEVTRMTSIGDHLEEIAKEVFLASQRADAVIATGGLGPTEDDRTSQAVAQALGRPLELHEPSLRKIQSIFEAMGVEMTSNNERQAWIPKGSTAIDNPMGTAPGFAIREGKCLMVFLPGVPRELERMLDETVVSLVRSHLGGPRFIASRTLRLFGIPESRIDNMVRGALDGLPGVSLASLPHYPENRLRVTVRGADPKEVASILDRAVGLLKEKVGSWVYGEDDEDLEGVVVSLLKKCGRRLAVAESCTGGLVAHRLTNVPGASEVLEASYVVYTQEAKEQLGVPGGVIEKHGVVSAEVAQYMAQAAASKAPPGTVGLGITGLAGPTGGTEEIPVGTVFIAMYDRGQYWYHRFRFRGGRGNVKTLASSAALDWLRRYLLGEDPAQYNVPWRQGQ